MAPSERARPHIEPAILRDHLRGAHPAKTKGTSRHKDRIGHEIIVGRQEIAVEQRLVEEAHRAGEQRHVDKDPPERLPGLGQAAAGEKRGAAAVSYTHLTLPTSTL